MAAVDTELRLNIADVSRRKQASRQASMDSCDLEQPARAGLPEYTENAPADDVPSTPTQCQQATPVLAPIAVPVAAPEGPKPVVFVGKPSLSPRRQFSRAEHGGSFNIFQAPDMPVAVPKGKAHVVPPYATDPNAKFEAPVRSAAAVADPVPPTAIDTAATRTPRKPGFPWQWAFTDDQGMPLPEPEMPAYEAVEAPDFACMSPRTDSYIALRA